MKYVKGVKENKSVADSLNAVVKTHLVNMSEQYNVYARAILEMEDKIKALKQIMLSQDFLNNIRDVNLAPPSCAIVNKKYNKDYNKDYNKESKKENRIVSNIHVENGNDTAVIQAEVEACSSQSPNFSFYTPRQKNSLFWCFYIIINGLGQYEYEKNYFTAEQEFKVKTIERIKRGESKQILKEHKMSKNMIESGLMGSCLEISPKILYALSLFYNVNIFYVYKNTYYEMFANTNAKIYVIQFNPEINYYSVSIDMHENRVEYIENIKKTCLELNNLDDVNKPLRSITSYSLTELVNIAAKMNILDTHIYDETMKNTGKKIKSKSKTKNELYTEIMEKCL
jgi:hypothetical protein